MITSSSIEQGSGVDRDRKIKVMLVDDSAVIRGLIGRSLETDDSIEIVSSLSNGEMAVKSIGRIDPDVIVLDIEMPVMDGITALPLLLKEKPGAKILICSTLSEKGASISMKALSLGATDCLVKPTSTDDLNGAGKFREDLLRLVRGLGGSALDAPIRESRKAAAATAKEPVEKEKIVLRNDPGIYTGKPDIIAIGSSTGGPQALFKVMSHLKNISVPVVITQHMPKTFTAMLAKHIEQNCGILTCEGAQDMVLENGHAYVAPGGFHMTLVRDSENNVVKINIVDSPQENFCKPSVDPMMRSVISLYGKKTLAVILTGMGSDGLKSCQKLAESGGRIVAQDEESSVVWGMPGAVAMAGVCTNVLPLENVGPWIENAVKGS